MADQDLRTSKRGDGMTVFARTECPEHGATGVLGGRCSAWEQPYVFCTRELVTVEYVPASHLEGAVSDLAAAEGRISLAVRRLQFAFQRAGIEVDAQELEGFVKHAAQHIERGQSAAVEAER